MSASGLVAVTYAHIGRETSRRERFVGLSSEASAETSRVEIRTPQGTAYSFRSDQRIFVDLDGLQADAGPVVEHVAIAEARRGLTGHIVEDALVIRRPRFGLRLRNRCAKFDAGDIHLSSLMTSPKTFSIHRADEDDVILTRDRDGTRIESSLSCVEALAALMFEQCGIIEGSALSNIIV